MCFHAERRAEGEAAPGAGRARRGEAAQRGGRGRPGARGDDPEARGETPAGRGPPRDLLPQAPTLLHLPLRQAHVPGRRRLSRRVSYTIPGIIIICKHVTL